MLVTHVNVLKIVKFVKFASVFPFIEKEAIKSIQESITCSRLLLIHAFILSRFRLLQFTFILTHF